MKTRSRRSRRHYCHLTDGLEGLPGSAPKPLRAAALSLHNMMLKAKILTGGSRFCSSEWKSKQQQNQHSPAQCRDSDAGI